MNKTSDSNSVNQFMKNWLTIAEENKPPDQMTSGDLIENLHSVGLTQIALDIESKLGLEVPIFIKSCELPGYKLNEVTFNFTFVFDKVKQT